MGMNVSSLGTSKSNFSFILHAKVLRVQVSLMEHPNENMTQIIQRTASLDDSKPRLKIFNHLTQKEEALTNLLFL
jgi:hypothetical protein